MRLTVLSMLAALAFAQPALAVDPGEMLADPALEKRAREVSKDLRCLVCQNQSIDDSDAGLARDLRVIVRERITAGDSNQQVVDYVVSRYGDYVLLKPPFKASTYALWFGPVALLLIAVAAVLGFYRRRAAQPEAAAPLSDEEKRRVDALLKDGDA
jgi:cytochrome c-type biogenesis protein CcmH